MVLKETQSTARTVPSGGLTVEEAERAPDVVALLTEALRGVPGELEPEYPLVFAPGAPGRLIVGRDERAQPVAGCAYLARRWHLPTGTFEAGLIGSVATHHEHRRQGWAARVLARAEAELARQGCVFALLWADDPAFYERLGYAPIGTEVNYLVEPGSPVVSAAHPATQGGVVRPWEPRDLAALHALHGTHPVRIERSMDEMSALLSIPGVETHVLEREGRAEAYACLGKGGDLQGVVHEWAGSPLDVARLAAELAQQRGENAVVLAPPSAEDHHKYFQSHLRWPHRSGILGMAKRLEATPWPADWGVPQDLVDRFPPTRYQPALGTPPFAWGLDSI